MNYKARAAIEHPFLNEFINLVDATAPDGIPSTTILLSEPFTKFRHNLIIYRHEPDLKDFRVILFGTEVVESYGEDWSGRLLSEVGFEKGYEIIYQVNLELLDGGARTADSGNLKRHFSDYKSWHEIKMPLRRNGEVTEILVFMCFS